MRNFSTGGSRPAPARKGPGSDEGTRALKCSLPFTSTGAQPRSESVHVDFARAGDEPVGAISRRGRSLRWALARGGRERAERRDGRLPPGAGARGSSDSRPPREGPADLGALLDGESRGSGEDGSSQKKEKKEQGGWVNGGRGAYLHYTQCNLGLVGGQNSPLVAFHPVRSSSPFPPPLARARPRPFR